MPAALASLRYCDHLGGTDFYLAASPSVLCSTASAVETKLFSRACSERIRCFAYGFRCVSVEDGRYDRPFSYTRHTLCRKRALRIEMNEG